MQRDSAWDGRTRLVAAGGGYRYVRIELRRGPLLTTAAVLAHELRHALEIHDAGVETTDQFEQLYRRIGTGVSGAPGAYDTAAAIDAGVATLAELTGRPVAPPASNRRRTASPPGTPTLRTRPLPKRRAAVATP